MRLEPREQRSPAILILYPVLALLASVIICALLVMLSGASPLSVFVLMVKGAAGTQFAFLETLTRATPLIFTGLAAATAFRAKLWNIGGEAQLYIGAVMTVVLGTGFLPLPQLRRAKIYLDLGNHPGKDRLPREAAMAGCCVITNQRGSAYFDADVPTPHKYKIDDRKSDYILNFQEFASSIFTNFDCHSAEFSHYRSLIAQERTLFESQVRKAFSAHVNSF